LNFKFKFYEWIEDMIGMLLGVYVFQLLGVLVKCMCMHVFFKI